MRRSRICLLGNFGSGNLGNDCTLQAAIDGIHRHCPSSTIHVVCTDPFETTNLHRVPAHAIRKSLAPAWSHKPGLLFRLLRGLLFVIPGYLVDWLRAVAVLRRIDLLIVPGTQILSDNLCGPRGWPYEVFQWVCASRLFGCRVRFLAVGVGPIRHPLSRRFIRWALSAAESRSYRDEESRRYAGEIGVDVSRDSVCPDLAFSLTLRNADTPDNKKTIALGVNDYFGQYDQDGPRSNPESVYQCYLERVGTFASTAIEQGYTINLIVGDVVYDKEPTRQLRAMVEDEIGCLDRLVECQIRCVSDLIDQIAQNQVVVSSRFHNLVLGLLMGRPVVALAYHHKSLTLLREAGLEQYGHHIDTLDPNLLVSDLSEIMNQYSDLQAAIRRTVRRWQHDLEEQYASLFSDSLW